MVREHLDTSLPRIIVVLDDRAAAYPRTRRRRSRRLRGGRFGVLAAVREELPVELIRLTGARADRDARAAHRLRPLLDRLAEAELTPGKAPEQVLAGSSSDCASTASATPWSTSPVPGAPPTSVDRGTPLRVPDDRGRRPSAPRTRYRPLWRDCSSSPSPTPTPSPSPGTASAQW